MLAGKGQLTLRTDISDYPLLLSMTTPLPILGCYYCHSLFFAIPHWLKLYVKMESNHLSFYSPTLRPYYVSITSILRSCYIKVDTRFHTIRNSQIVLASMLTYISTPLTIFRTQPTRISTRCDRMSIFWGNSFHPRLHLAPELGSG